MPSGPIVLPLVLALSIGPIVGAAAAQVGDAPLRALAERLGAGFRVEREGPFLVAGDVSDALFDSSRHGTIRWAYDHLTSEFFSHVPFRRAITIYLFRDDRSYRFHARRLFGDSPSTPFGYFSDRHSALVMNIATGGGTLVHELVHPLLDNDFPRVPAWFNEGLASLFEQSAEKGGSIVGLTNWRLAGLKKAIASGATVPLESLLATSSGEFYGARSGLHYAQARYLLYWLQEQGLLREFYRRFRAAGTADPTGRATLATLLRVGSVAEIEPAWLRFVAGLRFGVE